jgi:hypothetical protein
MLLLLHQYVLPSAHRALPEVLKVCCKAQQLVLAGGKAAL